MAAKTKKDTTDQTVEVAGLDVQVEPDAIASPDQYQESCALFNHVRVLAQAKFGHDWWQAKTAGIDLAKVSAKSALEAIQAEVT